VGGVGGVTQALQLVSKRRNQNLGAKRPGGGRVEKNSAALRAKGTKTERRSGGGGDGGKAWGEEA